MRRRVAHLAEVVERADDAASEVVMPDAIDDDARGKRVLPRREPFGERETASRRAAIRPRNLGGRAAVGGGGDEARLHLRTLVVGIAAQQEEGRRRLVATRTCMQETP